MIKLAIDSRMINSSGIGQVLRNLIPRLKNTFQIILLGDVNELSAFEWSKDLQLINFQCRIYSLSEQFKLRKFITQCDIFLSPHYNIPVFPIKAEYRAVIIHDVNHLALKNYLSVVQKFYAVFMFNRAVNLSDIIFTVSDFSKSEIIKYTHADSKKIIRAYCGVDKSIFNTSQESGLVSKVKSKFSLPEKYILFVGNIKPHKNLIQLLKAYKKLFNKFDNYNLVVAGQKEGFIIGDSEVVNFINENKDISDRIIFTGYMNNNELPIIYKLAYALVFPSLYEGFGLPVLEAMSSGCPVLVSDKASLPEVSGEAVLYFNPLDYNDICTKIEMLISDKELRKGLISKGNANIERFTWDNFAKIFSESLIGLIK